MMKATSRTAPLMSGSAAPGSGHLEGNALDDVEHVFAAVSNGLHCLVELFPLDDFNGVRAALEERRELIAQQAIGLVLEAIDLDRILPVIRRERAQAPHGTVRFLSRLDDDLAHGDAAVRRRLDLVEEKPVGHRIDEVQHVVQTARQGVDVLAVDRGDERGIQPADHFVGDGIARVLEITDLLDLGLSARIVERQLLQYSGRRDDMTGLLLEEIEEILVAWQEPEHASSSRGSSSMSTPQAQLTGGRLVARMRPCHPTSPPPAGKSAALAAGSRRLGAAIPTGPFADSHAD